MTEVCSYCGEIQDADNDGKYCYAKQGDHRWKVKGGIEQRRRDFKQADPDLYAYILAIEVAKALDSAGDTASGSLDGHHAANRIWRTAVQHQDRAQEMRAGEAS